MAACGRTLSPASCPQLPALRTLVVAGSRPGAAGGLDVCAFDQRIAW
jgi:hypothetical protein